MPTKYGAPPAGEEAAGPRPDLRGYRLGLKALLERPEDGVRARAVVGLIVGFVAALAIGTGLIAVGVPSIVALALAVLLDFAVVAWLPILLIDAADRRLVTLSVPLGRDAAQRWRRAFGSEPFPRTDEQSLLWLGARPAATNPEILDIEGSMLLRLGRYAEARDRFERLPSDTPWWRFARALGLAELEFESGGRGDLTQARDAAALLDGARAQAAIALLALEDGTRAMIRAEDWAPPIGRAAGQVGSRVTALLVWGLGRWRSVWPQLLVSAVGLGVLLSLVSSNRVG